jgi:PAS domain-containing protein
MARSAATRNAVFLFIAVFFLSAITVLFTMEFRFLKKIMTNYEESIRQIAINQTNYFLRDLEAVTERAARELARQDEKSAALDRLTMLDPRITGAWIIDDSGAVISGTSRETLKPEKKWVPRGTKTLILGVDKDQTGQMTVAAATPFRNNWLVLAYRAAGFQEEMTFNFLNTACKVAVFGPNNYPVVWPFEKEALSHFSHHEGRLLVDGVWHEVSSAKVGEPPWSLFFFFPENNLNIYRTLTIMFLLLALYCCLYQFLVELWRVNSALSYFENVDFAIFNYLNEGVIITNNAGRIVFANKAAHEIFSEKKKSLKGTPLKDILGHIGNAQSGAKTYGTLTFQISDRRFEAIHAPLVKKGKVLGAITVIGSGAQEKTCFNVLSRLIETLPMAVIYIDRHHKVAQANLLARCYWGTLEPGLSIDGVDPELAGFIYRNIGSRTIKPVKLTSSNTTAEVVYVYDEEGNYSGALVLVTTPPEVNSVL